MLRLAVSALLADARIAQVRVAVTPGAGVDDALTGLPRTVWRIACGGATRAGYGGRRVGRQRRGRRCLGAGA